MPINASTTETEAQGLSLRLFCTTEGLSQKNKHKVLRTVEMAQCEKCLQHKQEDLSSDPQSLCKKKE